MHFGSLSAQSTTDTLGRIQELHRQGQQERKDYNFEQALKLLLQAYELSDSQAYNLPHLDIQLSLAQLHYDIQNFDRAALEAHTYIQLIKPFDFPDKKAQAHVLLGHIYAQNGKWEEAEIFLRMADQYYTANGNNTSRAQVLLGYGILSIKRQEYQSAINYLEAASLEFERNDQIELLALAELYKAEASIKINPQTLNNSLSIARTALKKARGLAQKHKLFRLTIEAYRLDSYLALRENQYVAAENSLMTYEQKSDSLYQSFVNTIASTYNGQQDLVSLTDIIDQQKNDLDKQQKSISFSKITTGLSIALIVILSLLTLSLYKNNNLRAKANELLQDKNNELQLAKEKAEKASLVKAQFLSTITHELRTPLYAVTGLTHLLLEENPKPEQKEHLNSLQFSGEYLLSLINNILDLNKLEANKVEVEKVTFQLKKRLNDVLIALKKSADDRKNTLRLEYDESIPDKIEGDSLKLSQIFINLIGNSLKFTQNGDVVVRVSKINEKDNKVTLRFEIEDNGVGISKKKQKSIFESFSQASLQINRKFGGTGLGLSIVKNLLELMGSRIQLDSELGKGSKFWFDLVLEVSTNEITGVAGETVLSEDEYNSLENRQVLVVEDNKINQMITRKILEKRKIVCQVADNGMDAIKMVQENDFDVVLMDIHMPGISGIEATQEIRKFNPELPIIALTAVTIDENLDEFYRVGFNEIIPKPFKTEEFFEKIHRTLEQSIASKET
ncbi:MAG: response regulator [Flavobacteriaceae bacterium]|tara:strand:+ start:21322 stop:23517 length:2196 start_codon:yes stop_codon:yes gene_type:complete